jgi:hypothetical protein
MLPNLPRHLDQAARRAVVLVLVFLVHPAGKVQGQPLATHAFTSTFELLPDADPRWTRLGNAGAAVLPGPEGMELLVNDNSPGDCIAFQTLLGEIEPGHRATVNTRVRVLNNLGEHSVMIEVSRPGLELLVRLDIDRIEVHERRGGRDTFWLGGADADLSVYREVRVTKLGRAEDPRESLVVEVDGVEILRVAGRGDGALGVGRIVFGSLDYPSLGASVWRWVEVSIVPVAADGSLGADGASMSELKARYLR